MSSASAVMVSRSRALLLVTWSLGLLLTLAALGPALAPVAASTGETVGGDRLVLAEAVPDVLVVLPDVSPDGGEAAVELIDQLAALRGVAWVTADTGFHSAKVLSTPGRFSEGTNVLATKVIGKMTTNEALLITSTLGTSRPT